MTPFEEDLKRALQRQQPGVDFTARVLSRCAREEAKAARGFWTVPLWRMTIAAALLLAAGGGTVYQQHEHEVQGQLAKRKLLLAVRIAGTKLQQVQRRVVESAQVEQ
jgi:hypothetical protein